MKSYRLAPAGWLVLALMVFWAVALFALVSRASAADPLAWGRTYAVADSLVVPVRWNASCDVRGCADGYRVTWTIKGTVDSPQPRTSSGSSSLTPPSTAPATPTPLDVVIREVTVTRAVDTARVPLPDIGLPRTVCVYVTAIRRGLSSDVRAACRTVEAPDVAPPPVDSIRWDTLGVSRPFSLGDSLDELTEISFGAYQFRARGDVIDSIPVARAVTTAREDGITWLTMQTPTHHDVVYPDVSESRTAYHLEVGYQTVACAVTPLRDVPGTLVVAIPAEMMAADSVVTYRDRCRDGVRLDYPAATIRYYAQPTVTSPSDTSVLLPRGGYVVAQRASR